MEPYNPNRSNDIEENAKVIFKYALIKVLPIVPIARKSFKLFVKHPFAIGIPLATLAYLYRSARELEKINNERRLTILQ